MTNEEALKKFETALNLRRTPEFVDFHREIGDSDLPLGERMFWMCLCNDFEDLKHHFLENVKNFLKSGEEIHYTIWEKEIKGAKILNQEKFNLASEKISELVFMSEQRVSIKHIKGDVRGAKF